MLKLKISFLNIAFKSRVNHFISGMSILYQNSSLETTANLDLSQVKGQGHAKREKRIMCHNFGSN